MPDRQAKPEILAFRLISGLATRLSVQFFPFRGVTPFTTLDILKMEGLMLAAVERMNQKSAAVWPEFAEAAIDRAAKKLAEKGHKLFPEQIAAVGTHRVHDRQGRDREE